MTEYDSDIELDNNEDSDNSDNESVNDEVDVDVDVDEVYTVRLFGSGDISAAFVHAQLPSFTRGGEVIQALP